MMTGYNQHASFKVKKAAAYRLPATLGLQNSIRMVARGRPFHQGNKNTMNLPMFKILPSVEDLTSGFFHPPQGT